MGTVSEALELTDHVSGPAAKMAGAVDRVTAAMKRYKTADGAAKSKALAGVTKEVGGLRKIEAEQKRVFKERGAANKQDLESDKRSLGSSLKILGVVAAVGTVALATAVKVTKIGLAFVGAVAEANNLRNEAIGLLKVLGTSDAPKALEAVDKLSLKLGMSLEEGRKQFVALGKAGKTGTEIAGIMKMRADLIAAGNSAEMADAKLKPVLDAKGAGATAAALKEVGKSAGVAGDGVAAANKRLTTFEGFTDRLKQAPARIFDQLAKTAGPSLDKLGEKANKALNELLRSPEAAAAVGMVTAGLSKIVDVAGELIPLVVPFFKGFASAVAPIAKALGPVADALGKAFGGDSQSKMSTAEKIGKAVGVAFGIVAAAIGAVVAVGAIVVGSFVAIGVAAGGLGIAIGVLIGKAYQLAVGLPSILGSGINRAKAYLDLLIDSATATGSQIISGLVGGINSGVGTVVQAVKDLAGKVKSALTSELQIKSPSRVMQKLGGHISGGLAKGISGGQSQVQQASQGIGLVSAGGATAGATAGGGGGSVSVTINVTAAPGATKQDGNAIAEGILPVIRREITSMMRGMATEAA